MFADPPNADLLTVCQPGSDCYIRFKSQLDNMSSQGAHVEGGAPISVTGTNGVVDLGAASNGQIPNDTMYRVTYTIDPSAVLGSTIVDASGTVLYVVEPAPDAGEPTSRLLVRNPDDPELPWRYAD